MAEPTIEQLDAQIAELQRQRDIASLEGAKAIKAALVAGKVATLDTDLEAILPQLSSESLSAQQARNVISIIKGVRNLVDGEVARIQAIVDAQSPDQPPA